MCTQFTEVLLLVSLGLVFHSGCSTNKQTSVMSINCSDLNGTKPVDIKNSQYLLLPNGSICCPSSVLIMGQSYCIEESVMENHCSRRGVVYEPCFHCKTCAKLIGETCLGRHYIHGRCANGLVCIQKNGTDLQTSEEIGACSTPGSRPMRKPAERCGGTFDSIGICESESSCVEDDEMIEGVCVKQAKTKGFNEACGGRYGSLGRCGENLTCSVNETKFLKGKDISGNCYRSNKKACFKNCSMLRLQRVCGRNHTDNTYRWYRNGCSLRQSNCPFPQGAPRIHRVRNKEQCGIETEIFEEPPHPMPEETVPETPQVDELE